ncbi:unnamed protein product [Pocillopora meandrina]|uniref:Uncharacterized protein n=1 Tax=Pocillopora meandrina TaxID=46732 RepID=A0AAU9WBA1_9CNID|nr:unnamed protein product [Pocillopora meandrina]
MVPLVPVVVEIPRSADPWFSNTRRHRGVPKVPSGYEGNLTALLNGFTAVEQNHSGIDENDVEIEFIDQDYLPLARESEEEIDSDDFAESSGDESEELESEDDEDLEEEEEVPAWSEEITRRDDIDFSELAGLAANVNIRSLTLSKGFFDLFSTAQV